MLVSFNTLLSFYFILEIGDFRLKWEEKMAVASHWKMKRWTSSAILVLRQGWDLDSIGHLSRLEPF
jgi:hypothetical protein